MRVGCQYRQRRVEAIKIPLAVPMVENVCIRVSGRCNRLQIFREGPLGVTSTVYGQEVGWSVTGSYQSHQEPNLLDGEFGIKT